MHTQVQPPALHCPVKGEGPPLAALHGWGWSGQVFDAFLSELGVEQWCPDLPGHGHSPWWPHEQDSLVRQLETQLPQRMVMLGWSLGGLLAIAFAHAHPQRVRGLILLATNPRFVEGEDWPGQPAATLAQFAQQLVGDSQKTLQRFIALQGMSASREQTHVRQLRSLLASMPAANVAALQAGLQWLRDWDLRTSLAQLKVPVQIILGGHDRLIPPDLAGALQALHPDLDIAVLDEAGHAPFITHPAACGDIVQQCLVKWS